MIADLCILGCIGAALAIAFRMDEILKLVDRLLDGRRDAERRARIAAPPQQPPRPGFIWIVGTDTRFAREAAQLKPRGRG